MNDGTARIELRRLEGPSLWTVVDAEDFERVNRYRWRAQIRYHTTYVHSTMRIEGRAIDVPLHRFILDAPPGLMVDHIDHDGLNNRRSNLRLATRGQNRANSRRLAPGSSRFKGVTWHAQRKAWQALIKGPDGRNIHLGRHAREEDAALAYDVAARELFGEFACTNFTVEAARLMPTPARPVRRVMGDDLPHGRGRYTSRGCRCDVCKAAEREYGRIRSARDKARRAGA